MERTKLLNELVAIDARITEATGRAVHTPNDNAFENIIKEIRELRKQRLVIVARLALDDSSGRGDA
jgi:hypothetical protein